MKYIIEMPESVVIKYGCITIIGGLGWSAIEKAVHNAVPYEAPKEVKEKPTREELLTILSAWESVFGTSQLSHASARLQAAEDKANRLEFQIAHLEKPTANADLVGEVTAYIDNAADMEQDDYDAITKILSKYRPVPVVKEQGDTGSCPYPYPSFPSDIDQVIMSAAAAIANLRTIVGKRSRHRELIAVKECEKIRKYGDIINKKLRFTPAPVASGLVEEAFDMLKTLDYLGGLGHERHEQIRSILSRYSKEAK